MTVKRIGIIDIGSNSIRLVIYEQTETLAHRVIDESKEAARLSERISSDGSMSHKDVLAIVDILNHFKLLCQANRTSDIRAVATAAIRNASNCEQIVQQLRERTGLSIEVLSGDDEAEVGFLGMINTMDLQDGFLIDIGGGSTEISLFRQRTKLQSISLSIGAVNAAKQFAIEGAVTEAQAQELAQFIELATKEAPWIEQSPCLPLVGLGGTIRALCKLDQREKRYSLPQTHNYQMTLERASAIFNQLQGTPIEKRRKLDGLAKERADTIVPGLLIMILLAKKMKSSELIISGVGLRDGLFYESITGGRSVVTNVLDYSLQNLLRMHPSVSYDHVNQVNRISLALFDALHMKHQYQERVRKYLHAASLLYRIGVTINYYHFPLHTYHLMLHSRIDGLTHREMIICAMIASYKSKSKSRQLYAIHKDILLEQDLIMIEKLGNLLHLAIALDRSETQPVRELNIEIRKDELLLQAQARHKMAIEQRAVDSIAKEFYKIWKINIQLMPPILQ